LDDGTRPRAASEQELNGRLPDDGNATEGRSNSLPVPSGGWNERDSLLFSSTFGSMNAGARAHRAVEEVLAARALVAPSYGLAPPRPPSAADSAPRDNVTMMHLLRRAPPSVPAHEKPPPPDRSGEQIRSLLATLQAMTDDAARARAVSTDLARERDAAQRERDAARRAASDATARASFLEAEATSSEHALARERVAMVGRLSAASSEAEEDRRRAQAAEKRASEGEAATRASRSAEEMEMLRLQREAAGAAKEAAVQATRVSEARSEAAECRAALSLAQVEARTLSSLVSGLQAEVTKERGEAKRAGEALAGSSRAREEAMTAAQGAREALARSASAHSAAITEVTSELRAARAGAARLTVDLARVSAELTAAQLRAATATAAASAATAAQAAVAAVSGVAKGLPPSPRVPSSPALEATDTNVLALMLYAQKMEEEVAAGRRRAGAAAIASVLRAAVGRRHRAGLAGMGAIPAGVGRGGSLAALAFGSPPPAPRLPVSPTPFVLAPPSPSGAGGAELGADDALAQLAHVLAAAAVEATTLSGPAHSRSAGGVLLLRLVATAQGCVRAVGAALARRGAGGGEEGSMSSMSVGLIHDPSARLRGALAAAHERADRAEAEAASGMREAGELRLVLRALGGALTGLLTGLGAPARLDGTVVWGAGAVGGEDGGHDAALLQEGEGGIEGMSPPPPPPSSEAVSYASSLVAAVKAQVEGLTELLGGGADQARIPLSLPASLRALEAAVRASLHGQPPSPLPSLALALASYDSSAALLARDLEDEAARLRESEAEGGALERVRADADGRARESAAAIAGLKRQVDGAERLCRMTEVELSRERERSAATGAELEGLRAELAASTAATGRAKAELESLRVLTREALGSAREQFGAELSALQREAGEARAQVTELEAQVEAEREASQAREEAREGALGTEFRSQLGEAADAHRAQVASLSAELEAVLARVRRQGEAAEARASEHLSLSAELDAAVVRERRLEEAVEEARARELEAGARAETEFALLFEGAEVRVATLTADLAAARELLGSREDELEGVRAGEEGLRQELGEIRGRAEALSSVLSSVTGELESQMGAGAALTAQVQELTAKGTALTAQMESLRRKEGAGGAASLHALETRLLTTQQEAEMLRSRVAFLQREVAEAKDEVEGVRQEMRFAVQAADDHAKAYCARMLQQHA